MPKIIEKYNPSLILCPYSKNIVKGNPISETKKLLNESIKIAKNAQISNDKIVVDPAIGFFRRSSDVKNNLPYTKITHDWALRDIEIIKKLKSLKTTFPILVSISNKSFLGKLLGKEDPVDRYTGTAIAENAQISKDKIVVDPAIGFFRRSSDVKNKLPYTKINSDWAKRDIEIIKNLKLLKTNYPILVSISNKSFLGKLLGKDDPADRNTGTAIFEMLSIINGASIIRTHNPKITSDVIKMTKSLTKKFKKGL